MLSGIFLYRKQVWYKKGPWTRLTAVLLSLLTIFISSCSMLGPVYVKTGYRTDRIDTIRSVRLIVLKYSEKPELGPLISTIASDTIKVKTSYKILKKNNTGKIKKNKCRKDEGSFSFSVEELETFRGHIIIYIRGKLTRCGNDELIWRAEGRYEGKPGDKRLKSLVRQYSRIYGSVAELYTEPLYFLMKDIIDTLPDPEPVKN